MLRFHAYAAARSIESVTFRRCFVALEGNLKDFSLADMFRLLASGSKTGALHIDGPRGTGVVFFRAAARRRASGRARTRWRGLRLRLAGGRR